MFTNDRKITLSVGANRYSKNWQRQVMNYSDLVEKLKTPTRSLETLDAYLKLKKSEQDSLKDVGGFVGGALKGRQRLSHNVESRDLITLDFDNIASGMTDDVIKRVQILGCNYVIYSTRKHAGYKPRLRIIIPTDRTITVDEYEPIARKVAAMIGIEMADHTTFEPSRLMYWPSCSRDSEYVYKYEDKPFLSADGILNQYADWTDVSTWPQVPGAEIKERHLVDKQQDPTTKTGLVGAFCRTYDILSAMDKFIPGAYEEAGKDDRYTYAGGSTSGGAVIYQDGMFLYSHHATDPCSGKLVNAWDLIRLHKFSDLDEQAVENTPVAKMPSYVAMKELVKSDKTVMSKLDEERQEQAKTFFESIGQGSSDIDVEEENPDWKNLLEKNDNTSKNEKSIANIVTILTYDPSYRGKIWFDDFAGRLMVTCPLPWDKSEGSREWKDSDDAQLTLRLEQEYQITGKDKIENAVKVVSDNNKRNEVKDLIQSFRWDGVQRIPTLLHDYLGAEQSVYTEDIMKKSLTAAVARAFSDGGVKYDYMVIFTGKQGIGKSTFLSKLGMDWFSDSLYNFEGKEAAELIQGTLINEVGELSAMNKSETEAIKQFLSKTHDIYRAAYGRHTFKRPRRCVFFGSTNSNEFLKDATGNRRFWPIKVGVVAPTKNIFTDLDKEINQIWAEAHVYYMLGEPLYLDGESKEMSEKLQEDFREIDPWQIEIEEFLAKKIPPNWYSLKLQEQKSWWNGNFGCENKETGDSIGLIERDRVCVREIWQICFNGQMQYCSRRESNRITNILTGLPGWQKVEKSTRYGLFGVQKGFEKSKIIALKRV